MIVTLTLLVNGGDNGLPERQRYTTKSIKIFNDK